MWMLAKIHGLKERDKRKKLAPKRIHNESLPAGSSMYFYCQSCDHLACTLPESYPAWMKPKRFCDECQKLKDHGWI
jgi:hypothetical protein